MKAQILSSQQDASPGNGILHIQTKGFIWRRALSLKQSLPGLMMVHTQQVLESLLAGPLFSRFVLVLESSSRMQLKSNVQKTIFILMGPHHTFSNLSGE